MAGRAPAPLLGLLAGLGMLLATAPGAPAAVRDTGDVANDAGLQWGFDRIGAEEAWAAGRGAGTTIAVVDSGMALGHEDLAANVVGGVACRDTGGDPAQCRDAALDDDGHGTHVAGIAAAVAGNGVGIAGVAPDARLIGVKVLFRDCDGCQSSGASADVVAGIRWAADQGADVINLSLGSTTSTVFGSGFVDAVRYAWDRGAIPVVAAGNDFVLTADFGDAPALVVSATDRADGAPSYSTGVGTAHWAVAAPGGEGGDTETSCSQDGQPIGILSTFWARDDDGAYACLSGTSMAAPHVAGALAVLRSAGLTPTEAVEALLATAVDLGPPGPDGVFGRGRIDLAAAARAVPEIIAARPAPPATVAPSAATSSSVPTVPSSAAVPEPPDEVATPQPFDPASDAAVPVGLVAVAAAAVAANAAGAVLVVRRRRRHAPLLGRRARVDDVVDGPVA